MPLHTRHVQRYLAKVSGPLLDRQAGRYLRVIYVPEPESLFVITAYELTGKPLIAYRRRRKNKQQ